MAIWIAQKGVYSGISKGSYSGISLYLFVSRESILTLSLGFEEEGYVHVKVGEFIYVQIGFEVAEDEEIDDTVVVEKPGWPSSLFKKDFFVKTENQKAITLKYHPSKSAGGRAHRTRRIKSQYTALLKTDVSQIPQ